jgi:glutathione synthase/RimK-type ligase-like ATP-grasp enzyme
LRIALVTCERPIRRDVNVDFLGPALRLRGATVETPAWSDPSVDWAGFDLVMPSSTWDYYECEQAFRRWLGEAAAASLLVNPLELAEWNLDKRYLLELEAAGVPTIPTIWVDPGSTGTAAAAIAGREWETVVIKPVVDLGARNLARVSAEQAARMLDAYNVATMAQPYLPSVAAEGELAVIAIDGELAHSLRKLPARGDFRVQPDYGGTHEAAGIDDEIREIAAAALAAAPLDPLYARVDIVATDAGPAVIELELIEPSLYLDVEPRAAGTLADVLLAAARRR